MEHPDDGTLERFVLGSTSRTETARIRSHLKQCEWCSALEREVRNFYDQAEDVAQRLSSEPVSRHLPARRPVSIAPTPQDDLSVVPLRADWLWHVFPSPRMRAAAAAGGLVLAGIAIGMLILSNRGPSGSPAYHHFNIPASKVEIYSAAHERLWEIPALNLESERKSEEDGIGRRIAVFDIDGNGSNEVVLSLILPTDPGKRPFSLSAFSSSGAPLWRTSFPLTSLSYRKTSYDGPFSFSILHPWRDGNDRGIFVLAENGRSPMVVCRVDASGRVVGEFWHFGQLSSMRGEDLDGDGHDELILWGQEDTGYPEQRSNAVVMVLDPLKIVGRKQASATLGFTWEVSDAEKFYLRLPQTDINDAYGRHSVVSWMGEPGGDLLKFTTRMATQDKFVDLEFAFTKGLRAVEVKDNEWYRREHEDLRRKGLVRSALDPQYYKALVRGVRYWNGREWKAEVMRVER
jgi:anti-sigma factor RsiW